MTAGRYWFSPKGTPHYPAPHNLWSANWVSQELDPPPHLGEFPPLVRSYDKGAFGGATPPAVLIGDPSCIQLGDSFPPAADRSLPCGADSRCFTSQGLPLPVCPDAGVRIATVLFDGGRV